MPTPVPAGPTLPLVLTTGRLSAPHGFSTRVGGVSAGPFATLSLGNPDPLPHGVGRDPLPNIQENLRRILDAVGGPGREIVQVYQVHAGAVHVVRRGQPTHPGPRDTRADAIVTDDPSRILCIRVADCTPVLISSADGRIVAAVHAGWRGVIANVAANAIAAMRSLGAKDLSAAVGPCISVDHFEVGPEVVGEFRRVFGNTAPIRPSPTNPAKAHVDLKECLRRQLAAAEVGEIEVLPHCTYRDADLFFSHRRDKGVTGRMGGFIGPR